MKIWRWKSDEEFQNEILIFYCEMSLDVVIWLLKIQTLLNVRQGQYKNFLLQWLFYIELSGWAMAQNVNLDQKMKTDDDHRWLFDNKNIGNKNS